MEGANQVSIFKYNIYIHMCNVYVCVHGFAEQTGHSQYNSCLIKRRYYCPYKGIPKEEWLSAIKREEQQLASGAAAKAATATPDFSGSDTE